MKTQAKILLLFRLASIQDGKRNRSYIDKGYRSGFFLNQWLPQKEVRK